MIKVNFLLSTSDQKYAAQYGELDIWWLSFRMKFCGRRAFWQTFLVIHGPNMNFSVTSDSYSLHCWQWQPYLHVSCQDCWNTDSWQNASNRGQHQHETNHHTLTRKQPSLRYFNPKSPNEDTKPLQINTIEMPVTTSFYEVRQPPNLAGC